MAPKTLRCEYCADSVDINGDGQLATWIRNHLDYPHKDCCLIWPFARTQTGYAIIGMPARKVHRVMCELKNGPAPSAEHIAAHSCDRGHDACVNPHHILWKTHSENQYDRHKDGKVRPRTKLTPEQAREIRELKGLERTQDTAARFGIRESNVRLIQSGKSWREDSRRNHIFTREEFEQIRSPEWKDRFAKDIAAEYGVPASTIWRIRNGKSYRHFLEPEECQ